MARTLRRRVRPASCLRPCSDSIGIADGRLVPGGEVARALRPLLAAAVLAGQQAARERAPHEDADALVQPGGDELVLGVARLQRVVDLLADELRQAEDNYDASMQLTLLRSRVEDFEEGLIADAVSALGSQPAIEVIQVSSLRETEPWGPVEQPRYLNGAVALENIALPKSTCFRGSDSTSSSLPVVGLKSSRRTRSTSPPLFVWK